MSAYFCGDPICKRPVAVDGGATKPWPVRCAACGTHLYPKDVLDASRPKDLEPKRGQLMTEVDGQRRVVMSNELAVQDDTEADVANVMEMVAQPLHPKSSGNSVLVIAVVLVVVAIGGALLLLL